MAMTNNKKYNVLDLFCGCGGLSLGFEQAGYNILLGIDVWKEALNTFLFNHKQSKTLCADLSVLSPEEVYEEIEGKEIDVIIGGPPCQGFSMANRQRIIDDPRNQLYKAYLNFLGKVKPKFFVMENVRGMANKFDEIKQNFREYLGDSYKFDFRILYAQDFGVPQNRERFIMIGNRIGVEPLVIFEEIKKYQKPPFVLKDALVGLPHLGVKTEKGKVNVENEVSGYTERDFTYVQNDFYHFINGDRVITKLYNHKNRYNNERDIEIFSRLPQGANSLHESIADIMPYKRRNDIFKDKYFKLDEKQVCKTITSHMKFDCNMYIHPWESRGLSPREAARIQTFPDDFIFLGAQNLWYAQIGNAVPVKLAEAIGNGIKKFIK